MKFLFDTNVLVAAVVQSHPHHSMARPWLERAKQGAFELFVSAHSLAEMYASLTRLPLSPPIASHEAWTLIRDDVLDAATVTSLQPTDYQQLIEAVSQAGHTGGIIYDGVIAKAGQIAGVDHVLTFNTAHFLRVWAGDSAQVISPQTSSPP